MKVVVVTTEADMLGGVFAEAYYAAGGPAPHAIVVLPPRGDLRHPMWARGLVAWKLLGTSGIARVTAARHLARPFPSDAALGLHRRWLPRLAGPDTRVIPRPSVNDAETLAILRELAPDVLVSIGAPVIFGEAVLSVPTIAAINVHNGRLPSYRGHFGTFWEVRAREEWAYTSIHEMTPKVDAGRLLASDRVRVADSGSLLDLMIEKKRRGGRLLATLLRDAERLGGLPENAGGPATNGDASRYFGWPTVRDVLGFSFPSR